MNRLLIARHGETDWNREGRWQGFSDQPLNPLGRRQARALAGRLDGAGIAALYASDLARAEQTAAAVSARTGLAVTADRRLREIDVGAWSGLSREQVRARDPGAYAAWECGELERYPEGESFAELRRRTAEAFAEIGARHPGQTVAVVCHGGSIRTITAELLQMPAGGHRLLRTGPNCSVSVFERDNGRMRLVQYNDDAHVPAGL